MKEHVDRLSNKAGVGFAAGVFAENLLVEGLDHAQMVTGRYLEVGKVVLQIKHVGKEAGIQHSYQYQGYSLLPQFGILATVIESRIIKKGDEVDLLISDS